MTAGLAGVNGEEPEQEPTREPAREHRHRRGSESGERSHGRSGDQIALTSAGVQVPWAKVVSAATLLVSFATPVAFGWLAKSHLELGTRVEQRVEQARGKTDEKLDRLLDGVYRLEKRQESFEERQRQTELDVAALKATRNEKERPR